MSISEVAPVSPATPVRAAPAVEHFVRFYDSDPALAEAITDFFAAGLEAGSPTVLVAEKSHRRSVNERLRGRGFDLAALERDGRYVCLDAADTLATLMVDGWPDASRFEQIVGDALACTRSAPDAGPVRIFGELVALLCNAGKRDAAVRLERLWNDLGRRRPIALFCAYPMSAFADESSGSAFAEICAEHGRVIPTERFERLELPDDRLRLVSELQQKALALASETARRKDLEACLARREKEFSEFVDRIDDEVVDVEPGGRIRAANRSHLERSGHAAQDYIGRPIGEFLSPPETFERVWSQLARGESLRETDAELRRADGSMEPICIRSGSLRMVGGSVQMRWVLGRRRPVSLTG